MNGVDSREQTGCATDTFHPCADGESGPISPAVEPGRNGRSSMDNGRRHRFDSNGDDTCMRSSIQDGLREG